jgi:O-antigen/teichoic acid export membrane protein
MSTAIIIAVTVIIAVLIIVLSNYIMRLIYEKRFSTWREEAIQLWQAEVE